MLFVLSSVDIAARQVQIGAARKSCRTRPNRRGARAFPGDCELASEEAQMSKPYIVYGQKGTGSVPVEATLLLLGEPYEVRERGPAEDRPAGNPMQQVPVLILPNGELMTESAAILIHLADSHPASRLSPALDDPRRPAFLRWMLYISSQIYALIWLRDDPSRIITDEAHRQSVLDRTAERMAYCWQMMDQQVSPGRYLLGDELSVLDLYVTVVSAWGARRERFYQGAPKMTEVVRRVDADPRLAAFWAERFS
jgi:GST-like protein